MNGGWTENSFSIQFQPLSRLAPTYYIICIPTIYIHLLTFGPWIQGPRQCPKLAYQGKKKMHEFAHGKCFVFLLKNALEQDLSMFALMSSLWWSFLPQFKGVILWGREREDQVIPIMHVGCNSNYLPNSSRGWDH